MAVEPEKPFTMWPRLGALLTVVGGGFAYAAANWETVEPVLSSPATILVSMLTLYGLGGLSTYWLIARPLEYRLNRAEDVIRRMRDRERELGEQIADLRVELAKLEVWVMKRELPNLPEPLPGTTPKQP